MGRILVNLDDLKTGVQETKKPGVIGQAGKIFNVLPFALYSADYLFAIVLLDKKILAQRPFFGRWPGVVQS
jgi:hypothetical protein